jgi:hypothetical protein
MTIIGGMDYYLCPGCWREHGVWCYVSTNNFFGPGAEQSDTIQCKCGRTFSLSGMKPYRHDDRFNEMKGAWKRQVELHKRLGLPPPEREEGGRRRRTTRHYPHDDFETEPSLTTVKMWVASLELQGWQVGEISSGAGTQSDWIVEVREAPDAPIQSIAVDVILFRDQVADDARARLAVALRDYEDREVSKEEGKQVYERYRADFEAGYPKYTPDSLAKLIAAATALKDQFRGDPTGRVLLVLGTDERFREEMVRKALSTLVPPQSYENVYVVLPHAQERHRYPVHEVPGRRAVA